MSDRPALVFLQRIVVEGVVVPLVVVEVVFVFVFGVRVEVDVGEGSGAFTEQAVVEALLQFPRFTEPASSSFSRHVVTCLARAAKSSLHRWPWPRGVPSFCRSRSRGVCTSPGWSSLPERPIPVPVEMYHFA